MPVEPTSRKPAEMMIAEPTAASTQRPITPGAAAAGVTITARSTFSGTAATSGQQGTPSTLRRLGLTGYTGPPNGVRSRLLSTVRPTLPGVSVAPTTATLRG